MRLNFAVFGSNTFKLQDDKLFNVQSKGFSSNEIIIKIEPEPSLASPECTRIVFVNMSGEAIAALNQNQNTGCTPIWVTLPDPLEGTPTNGSGSVNNPPNNTGVGGSTGNLSWYNGVPCINYTPGAPPPPGMIYPPQCTNIMPVLPI